MRKLQVTISSIHEFIKNQKLNNFVWVRFLCGLVFLEILIENLLDSHYIAVTSLVYLKKSGFANSLQLFLGDFILSNPTYYVVFLFFCIFSTLLYISGLGGKWSLVIFLIFEFIFQNINIGNKYAHEWAVHQFIILLVFIELGQAKFAFIGSSLNSWKPSILSGWAILLLKFQFLIVYFMSGLGKILSSDWDSPKILEIIFLNTMYPSSFIDKFFMQLGDYAWVFVLIIKGFLISFPFLVCFKFTRKFALLCGVCFHALIAFKLTLYGFSFLMVSLYLMFIKDFSARKSDNI